MAKRIFNSLVHLYQIHSVAISCELREFFTRSSNNSIEFWDYPSCCNWRLHSIVDKVTEKFNLISILPCKSSWDFSRRNECNNILNSLKMYFQALDDKGWCFLELCDDDIQPIIPSIAKGRPWLKYFGHSNSLCVRASRAIVNYTPIDEYWLKFFPRKKFECPYSLYPIKSRWHILHKCRRYNNYCNPRWDSIAYFILFLKFNSDAFSFGDGIT